MGADGSAPVGTRHEVETRANHVVAPAAEPLDRGERALERAARAWP